MPAEPTEPQTRSIRSRHVRQWDQLLVHRHAGITPAPFTVAEVRDDSAAECVHLTSIEGAYRLVTYGETAELLSRPAVKAGIPQAVLGRCILLSAAWYGPSNIRAFDYTDEIFIGSPDSGVGFALRWYPLRGNRAPSPRLEVFDDAWGYFARLGPLHQLLARYQNQNASAPDLLPLLVAAGFADETPREKR